MSIPHRRQYVKLFNLRCSEEYPEIDWVAVVGFRNIVIHEYFDVDLEIVWTIATQRLEEFRTIVLQMIEAESTE